MTDNTLQYELKIQALLERVSTLTTEYENKVADLRVELTMTAQQLEQAVKEIKAHQELDAGVKENPEDVQENKD